VKKTGRALLIAIVLVAAGAPLLAPNPPDRQFTQYLFAPPTHVRLLDGGLTAPYFFPLRIVNRLER